MYFSRTVINLWLCIVGLLWYIFSVKSCLIGNSLYYDGVLNVSQRKIKYWACVFYNLHRTNERLAEMSTKLLVKKQQNKSLLSSLITRPVLEPQGVGSLNHGLISHGNFVPRENLVTPVSTPQISRKSPETPLSKVGYVIFFALGFRFLK